MSPIDLAEKFPRMTPSNSAPALFRIHGCGFGLYGKRDRDAETNTHVATWCLSIFFLPALALKAYRVLPAERGWYFIGREPISSLARWWNISVILSVIGIIAGVKFEEYQKSPARLAAKQLEQARSLADQGKLAEAARAYQGLVNSNSPEAGSAVRGIKELLTGPCQEASLTESAVVVSVAASIAQQRQSISQVEVLQPSLKLVASKGQTDPTSALAILDACGSLARDDRQLADERERLLKLAVAREPLNSKLVGPLAMLLVKQNQPDEAEKLLLPIKERLSDDEGAQALGLILARRGDLDGAYKYLWPYAKTRLNRLHAAEQAANNAYKQITDREFNKLRDNQGPPEFYQRLNAVDEATSNSMVQTYLYDKIKHDSQYLESMRELEASSEVVPTALELGMIMLQRAQAEQNPEARKPQLQAAEDTFLAIGGAAGQTDEYQLSLAQVKYWLGKQDEGRKLFDEYLAKKQRDFNSLLQVGRLQHALGSDAETRAFAEEAFGKAANNDERTRAVGLRASVSLDNDDRLDWLGKAHSSDSELVAELARARGNKALDEGQDEEARRQFRVAIGELEKLPRSASTLNELALAHYSVFLVTGDEESFDRCQTMLQQAVDLAPSDATLVYNAAITIVLGAVQEIVGKDLNLHALHESASLDTLGWLYSDAAGREALIQRLQAHAGLIRGAALMDKAVLLAPKRAGGYQMLLDLALHLHKDDALAPLEERLRAADVDHQAEFTKLQERALGLKDNQLQTILATSLKRAREVQAGLPNQADRTASYASGKQVELLLSARTVGSVADPDEVVRLAESADHIATSTRSKSLLMAAYCYRAAEQLSRDNAEFAALREKHFRTLTDRLLIAVAVSEPSTYRDAVTNHPDVRRTLALIREQTRLFPEDPSPYEWAMLKAADPAAAETLAAAMRKSTRATRGAAIGLLLEPTSPDAVLESYWLYQIRNEPDKAAAVLKQLTDAGLKSPIQP